MSQNPNSLPEPQDQTTNVNNWNANEFGLQPRNRLEYIIKNFIKSFAYNWLWDPNNNIWRAARSDSNGNIRTSTGGQALNSPLISVKTVVATGTVVLLPNTNRRSFLLLNNGITPTDQFGAFAISYPNPASTGQVILSPGYSWYDTSWQGAVTLFAQNLIGHQDLTIIETFY